MGYSAVSPTGRLAVGFLREQSLGVVLSLGMLEPCGGTHPWCGRGWGSAGLDPQPRQKPRLLYGSEENAYGKHSILCIH